MKVHFIVWMLLSVACKPLQTQSSDSLGFSASLVDNEIRFTGSADAKIDYCDSPSDSIEALVKESADAEWKSASNADRTNVYILDDKLQIYEPNQGCEASTALHSLTESPLFVAKTVNVPKGEVAIGTANLAMLKKFAPKSTLSADSKIPVFVTAKTRFAKLDFVVLNAHGTKASKFVQEFEVK